MTSIRMKSRKSRIRFRLIFGIGYALLISAVAIPAGADNRYEQRERYREAVDALERGQRSRFRTLKDSLVDYPLWPWLQQAELMRYLDQTSHGHLDSFLRQFQGMPIAERLLQNYLFLLAEEKDWETFLRLDRENLPSKILACIRPLAWHGTGREDRALNLTDQLWLVGWSQPDECDEAFRIWRGKNRLTENMAWERLRLALRQRNESLGRYVSNFLPSEMQSHAKRYRQLMRKPEDLGKSLASLQASIRKADHARAERLRLIITEPLRRLARQDANLALNIWQDVDFSTFSMQEESAMERWLLLWLLRQRDPQQRADELSRVAPDQELTEARIRLALARGQLAQLPELIRRLPTDAQQQSRWRYWLAQALSEEEAPEIARRGQQLMEQLARERDYYGFLAADRMGRRYYLQETNPDIQLLTLDESHPAIERALELYVLGDLPKARLEWKYALSKAGENQLLSAAVLADQWRWHERAIRTLLASRELDLLRIRFPLAYVDEIGHQARYNDLPVPWALAVARQESAFMPDVRSPADALGLMQITPGTANLISRELDLGKISSNQLLVPKTNIQLGTAYLRQMMERFFQNRILASAAYNAGPRRVEAWIEAQKGLAPDAWIEVIPFSETRNYVQNVLYFSVIYSYITHHPDLMVSFSEADWFESGYSEETGSGSRTPFAANQD